MGEGKLSLFYYETLTQDYSVMAHTQKDTGHDTKPSIYKPITLDYYDVNPNTIVQ